MAIESPNFENDNGTGTLDPVEVEYLSREPEDAAISIHMHLGAVDGVARDVVERLGKQTRPIVEVGGLLLGRLKTGDRPEVWIERYQRIPCAHTFGPKFVLDRDDMEGLERAAASVLANGDLAVVGFYRSNARPGFQLEESDFELIRRYFSDPADLILLIRAEEPVNLSGQFYTWDPGSGARPVGEEFPFRGRVVTSDARRDIAPNTADMPDDTEATGLSRPSPAPVPPLAAPHRELPRRIVADFTLPPAEPAASRHGLANSVPDAWPPPGDSADDGNSASGMKKWLPVLTALLLVGGISWLVLKPTRHVVSNPATAQNAETGRPLGLYVDTSGSSWRVLWNPNATALHDARTVQLFIREGDDQNRIDLSAADLASGSHQYKPVGNDVTFRLEVVDQTGQVSAESFRLLRETTSAANVAPSASAPPPPAPSAASKLSPTPASAPKQRFTPPKATYRAPPVVAAGIRPRIKGTIAIDVRVHIDTRGRVTSAAPVTKQHSGLEDYLASRAVQAARTWRFEPARESGAAVPGTQTLHFVFEK